VSPADRLTIDSMSYSTRMRPARQSHLNRSIFRGLAVGLVATSTLLSGCVYRLNIQQGNYLEGRTVDQLQAGMTRSQVRYLLGTPMVPDAFDKERWDYLYYFKRGRLKRPVERHLIVWFKDEKVDHFERNNVPETPPMAPDDGAPIAKFPKI
jgi:outer membrane protein assembly factor BamE